MTEQWCPPQMLVTVPESHSSSTMSLAADGGSFAGSAAGIGVDIEGVQEVQVSARAVAVGMANLDSLDLHEQSSCAKILDLGQFDSGQFDLGQFELGPVYPI